MAGLGDTLAELAAAQRTFAGRLQMPGRLREIADFGDDSGALRMLVHVPQKLAQPRSLVVVLHGCTQTAEDHADGAGWLTLADRLGFIVLCPEQVRANNPQLCFNWFQPGDTVRGGGEAASIRAMIQQAVGDYGVDSRRIFVTGLSAGGAMANVMLATYPEVFSAGAIIAGLPYGAARDMSEALAAMKAPRHRPAQAWGDAVRAASPHSGPWPKVAIWQGDQDRVVVPEVAIALADQWTDIHDVSEHGIETSTHQPGRRCTRWRSARGETVVELHRIAGMGHGTPISSTPPDGCGTPGPYRLDVGISAASEIAHSWGLEPVGALHPTGETPRAAAPPRATSPLDAVLKVEGHASKVITEALRSVGLIR